MLTEWLMRLVPRGLIGNREISLPWENYETRKQRYEIEDAARRYAAAEAPIVERLKLEGLAVASLDELVNGDLDYRQHESVLLAALQDVPDYGVRETLVRALTEPWAKESVEVLLSEFRRAEAPEDYRWAVGNAIEAIAPRDVTGELIELALDRRYGTSRQMVVLALGRTQDPAVIEPLIALLSDRDVQGHAADALGVVGDARALGPLQALTAADRDWVKREARRAVDRITTRERAVDGPT